MILDDASRTAYGAGFNKAMEDFGVSSASDACKTAHDKGFQQALIDFGLASTSPIASVYTKEAKAGWFQRLRSALTGGGKTVEEGAALEQAAPRVLQEGELLAQAPGQELSHWGAGTAHSDLPWKTRLWRAIKADPTPRAVVTDAELAAEFGGAVPRSTLVRHPQTNEMVPIGNLPEAAVFTMGRQPEVVQAIQEARSVAKATEGAPSALRQTIVGRQDQVDRLGVALKGGRGKPPPGSAPPGIGGPQAAAPFETKARAVLESNPAATALVEHEIAAVRSLHPNMSSGEQWTTTMSNIQNRVSTAESLGLSAEQIGALTPQQLTRISEISRSGKALNQGDHQFLQTVGADSSRLTGASTPVDKLRGQLSDRGVSVSRSSASPQTNPVWTTASTDPVARLQAAVQKGRTGPPVNPEFAPPAVLQHSLATMPKHDLKMPATATATAPTNVIPGRFMPLNSPPGGSQLPPPGVPNKLNKPQPIKVSPTNTGTQGPIKINEGMNLVKPNKLTPSAPSSHVNPPSSMVSPGGMAAMGIGGAALGAGLGYAASPKPTARNSLRYYTGY